MFTRPIIFLDLETTSTKTDEARICQISLMKLDTALAITDRITMLVNPTVKMPKGPQAIHGITDEMVKSSPTFKDIAKQLASFMKNCDVGGYNVARFDIPVLLHEFSRAEVFFSTDFIVFDVQAIFHHFNRRTLADAYRHYKFKDLENAHDATADNMATLEVFKEQLKRHSHDLQTLEDIHEVSYGGKVVDLEGKFLEIEDSSSETGTTIVFNFGPHKGFPVSTQMGFLRWITNKDSFTHHVRTIADELYNEVYNRKNPVKPL
jgi:DNA polymerase-3 subunit epsilon